MRQLRGELRLLTLGPYAPEDLTGPAIWLRCVVAGTLPEVELPEGAPVIYLPGFGRRISGPSRNALPGCVRSPSCSNRGAFFTHRNDCDWTPAGFLQNRLGV